LQYFVDEISFVILVFQTHLLQIHFFSKKKRDNINTFMLLIAKRIPKLLLTFLGKNGLYAAFLFACCFHQRTWEQHDASFAQK